MFNRFIETLKNESYTIFALSGAILLLTLSVRYVLVPQFTSVLKYSSEIETYKDFMSSENGKSLLGKELEQKNNTLLEKYSSMTSTPGTTGDLSGTLELLIKKAKEADIRFIKMEPQPDKILKDYTISPVKLELKTSYHSLGRFINSIEAYPHLVRLNKISFDTESDDRINVNLMANCYSYSRGADER